MPRRSLWSRIFARKTDDLTAEEMAEIIQGFVDGTCGPWDWDDFMHCKISNLELAALRDRCIGIDREYPPTHSREYCNKDGVAVLRKIASELKQGRITTR